MKKILYVCPSSGVGGAETFLLQTQIECDKDAFENHYLLFRAGPLYDSLQSLGARVHLLNTPPRISKRSDRRVVQKKLVDLINGYNIDLVHSTMAYGALFSAWTCKKMKVPHVWFQHGPASGWMDRLAAVLHHDGLIVNSHYTGKTQRALENPVRFLIPRKNPIEKILLGTPVVDWSSGDIKKEKDRWAQQGRFDTSLPLLGMVCRIQKWKGVHLILDAVKQIKEDTSVPGFQVIVWGEAFNGKDYLANLKKQVAENKLPVFFAGKTENASLSLATCEAVINASIQPEPFGLSIIEGMMVGAVPLVPNEGGPAEVISNGKNGLVFKARQSASLAKQLKTLLLDPPLRAQLSKNGKEVARQKFNSARAIGHLESFHTKIMGQ